MEQTKEYFAFISYKSDDAEWAIWLQHELEHYHLPASFNGRTDIRQDLRPVFRDIDELSAGNLPEQIKQALENSQNLIVVCSPKAAASQWVNQEVETFIALGRTDYIYPFIVEGNSPKEFFPAALQNLPKREERLGGDVSKNGRDSAFVKVVAGMLGVSFDSLWQRYEREKAERERKEREEKEKLQISQSRYSAEKAKAIVEADPLLATRIAIDLLPTNLQMPDRPYVPEAESLLRESLEFNKYTYYSEESICYVKFSPDERFLVASLMYNGFCIWDINTGEMICKKVIDDLFANYFSYNSDFSQIVTCSSTFKQIHIWNIEKAKIINTIDVGEDGNKLVEFLDNDTLVIVTGENEVILWDIKSNCLIRKIGFYSSVLYNDAAICPKCGLYCKIKDTSHIVVENIQTGISVAEFNAFEGSYKTYINNVTFSSDGKLLGAQLDNKLYFWDIQNSELLNIVGNIKDPIGAMAIDAANLQVALGLSNKRIIEIRDIVQWQLKDVVYDQNPNDMILSFGRNGNTLLICTRLYLNANIININHNPPRTQKKKLNKHIVKSFCSPQKNLLTVVDESGEIKILNTIDFKTLYSFRTGLKDIYSIAISNDCKHVLTISSTDLVSDEKYLLQLKKEDEDVQTILTIWGIDGSICSIIDCPNDYPSIAEFTIDLKYIIMESFGGVQIWYNHNNNLIKEWESEDVNFDKLACDKLGNVFAISSTDEHSIRLYDIKNHTLLQLFEGDTDDFSCIAISDDGNYIAAGSNKGIVRVWDVHSGHLVSSWKVYDFHILSLSFGHDINKIITITYDSLQVWDMLSGTHIQLIEKSSFSGWNNTIHVLNDGQLLIITDESISSYKIAPLQDLIDEARSRVSKRELTHYEKRKFYLV